MYTRFGWYSLTALIHDIRSDVLWQTHMFCIVTHTQSTAILVDNLDPGKVEMFIPAENANPGCSPARAIIGLAICE